MSKTYVATLDFGAQRPDRPEVSDAEFDLFTLEEIIPRFPAGFSIQPQTGYWRNEYGITIRERSWHLRVAIAHYADTTKLHDIAQAYKCRHDQTSVLYTCRMTDMAFI